MVLTKALEAYGKYFRLIAAIVLPVGLLTGLILCGISNSEYMPTLDYLVVFNIPGWLLSPLWIGALIYALSMLESGQEFTYKNAVVYGLAKWWKLVIIGVIVIGFKYIPVVGSKFTFEHSFLFSYLPFLIAIFIVMRYIFIFPVLTLENRGPLESLRRCAELSNGKRLSMFFEFIGLWFLLKVVKFLMTMLLGMAGNLLGGIFFTHVYFIIVIGMIEPVMNSLIIVWIYYYYLEQNKSIKT